MVLFDLLRGFSVVSMVLFHLCYDLQVLYGVSLPFFHAPLQDIWRASISWTFLFVAGCMCTFSRDAVRRGLRYLICALLVFVVTAVASVDVPISFGIIFCMGASTLLEHGLQRLQCAPRGLLAAGVLFVAFLLLQGVPQGYLGLPSWQLRLPAQLYETSWLAALGFPGPGFVSGDYYPLLPYCLMFLCGAAWARHMADRGFPSWFSTVACAPLEWVGTHSLGIYLAHQPVLLGMCEVLRRAAALLG